MKQWFNSLMWNWGWMRRKRAYEIIDSIQEREGRYRQALTSLEEQMRQEAANRHLVRSEAARKGNITKKAKRAVLGGAE